MTWTKDKPTTPGEYWWKRRKKCRKYRVEVRRSGNHLEVWFDGDRCADLRDDVTGEWAGPIEPPEEG